METRNYHDLTTLLSEFKRHLRITSTDLDDELLSKLKSAILMAEHEISTVIAPSDFTLKCGFSSILKLRWPTTGVTSVKVDGDTLSEDSYTFSECRLDFDDNITGNAVEVVYTAGITEMPEDIKAAVFLLGGNLFNNPTDRPEEKDKTAARNQLRPYRTWGKH